MGYTHYITTGKKISDKSFKSIKADIKKIEAYMKKIGTPLFDGLGENLGVVYTDDYIAFNGDDSKGENHETFYLDKNDEGFSFCKTATKPYDLAVCLALLSIKKHEPSVKISSDGDSDDWSEAVEAFGEVFEEISIEFGDGISIGFPTTQK